MRKLLIPLMVILLALTVAAEEQTITIGKYTVEGEDLVYFSNENKEVASIKLPLEEWTTITWKPDPKEDEFCLDNCAFKEEKECTCNLFVYGLSCILIADGTCKGVADEDVSIHVKFNDLTETEKEYTFSSFTKLDYNIIKREFTIESKKFEYQKHTISSEKPLKIYGNMILGDCAINNFDISSQKESIAKTYIFPDKILASKNTNVKYTPTITLSFGDELPRDSSIMIEGRKDSYEVCFNEENCNAMGSHVIIDEYKELFYAEGKSDGGPRIVFSPGSAFLRAKSDNTKFEINNLEDSSMKITLNDVLPEVEIKTSSDKISSDTADPPVSFTNGNLKLALYSDNLLAGNTKEAAESVAIALTLTDKNNQEIIGKKIGKGPTKIIFSEENRFKIASATEDPIVTYNRILLETPLFKTLPKLQAINGFNEEETKTLKKDLENLPKVLTSNLKNIHLLSPEQINSVCASSTTKQFKFTIGGCADQLGNIYLEESAFNNEQSNVLAHELTHIYIYETQSKNPETIELKKEAEKAIMDFYNLQKTEGIGYGAGASPEYAELSKKVETLRAEYEESATKETIIQKWLTTNTAGTMQEGCKKGYCSDKVVTNPKGYIVWADTKTSEPRYGVVQPYSCLNCEEDLTTFVQMSYETPEALASEIKCPPPNAYAKKLSLLREYGLIDNTRYNSMIPKEVRACIGGGT